MYGTKLSLRFWFSMNNNLLYTLKYSPVLFAPLSPSLSMGEFKNGQISVSSIILSNVLGRIQDGVEVFESAEWRKLHGRN